MAKLILSNFLIVLLLCLLVHSRFHDAEAHSYLTYPEPYVRNNCQGGKCEACPEIYHDTRLSNSESSPEVTWKRGENITIVWARNNHGGGFVRLAFVPVSKRKDISAHAPYAFYYGCWEQNIFSCSGSLCGSDNSGRAYRAFTSVPTVIPDGVYILAQIWYGGLKYTRLRGTFSNYASCSYIRIQGGVPLQSKFNPVYVPGALGEFESSPPGKCLTSAVKVGECLTGCDNVAAFFALPYEFSGGRIPAALTPSLYNSFVSNPNAVPNTDSGSRNSQSGGGKSGGSSKKSGRVCNHRYCCPKMCGTCGGRGCAQRPGGIDKCCIRRIKASGRRCRQSSPPCKM